ncbi:hypothetical protein MJO28_006339 [Puccinia striiformis f. sp. tritici]|uniref:Uncharacterized protein n=1 Tax=Puccinia striiformis f. sp. tritici TaxID=168172 RepID=A0ACC0EGM3_9BASI|nr:hypothetical protein MJO28_006339 [Puccinia striiformis f. sp. tritici]
MADKDPPSPPYLADDELPHNIRRPRTTPISALAGSSTNNLIQQQVKDQRDGLTLPFLTSPADIIKAKQKHSERVMHPPTSTSQPLNPVVCLPQSFTPASYNSHTAHPVFNNPMLHQPTPTAPTAISSTIDPTTAAPPQVDTPPHSVPHPAYTPHPSMPTFSQVPHAQHPHYPYMPYPYPFPHFPNPAPPPPPTHPTTPPDHHSSSESYHRQSQYDYAQDVYRLKRMEEDDRRNTSIAMGNVIKMIEPENRLLADGKNYRPWVRHIRELASQFVYDEDFFTKASSNIHHEKIGRTILLKSVDPSLKDSLSTISSCFDIFKHLKTRFWAICRAAQINTFSRLLYIQPASFLATSAYSAEVKDIVADLKALNGELNEDHILGFLLQLNLPDGDIKKELAQQVENIMYNDPLHQTPTFDSLVTLLSVVRQQISLSQTPSHSIQSNVPTPPHMSFQAATTDQIQSPEEDQTDEPSDISANAVRNHNCHICRQPGHYAADCPSRKKPPAQRSNQSYARPHYSSYPPQYHSYCPIVVAPNFSPYGHTPQIPQFQFPPIPNSQRQVPYQQHPSQPIPAPAPSQNIPRKHDSYIPAYPRQRPPSMTAKNVDVGTVEDELAELQMNGDPSADAIGLTPDVITDTGASNHLTGDRLALFDFRLLKTPIPLRVATDGCNDCVTGMGTLIFPGRSGTTVSVKGVMFCEQARSTLISPSALRRAKLTISYDPSSDAFLFKSPEGEILLESYMDRSRRCWTLPQPLRPANFSSSSLSSHQSRARNPVSLNVPLPKPPTTVPRPENAMPISLPTSSEITSSIFSFPIDKPDFNWHASDLTKNEIELLFWHRLFGHCGLRQIQKMINLKLGIGLPAKIPEGDIKCPVCMIAKGTRTNKLLPTYRPVAPLDIIAADLMGPFEVPTFGEGKYVLAIRDIATSYSEVKILRTKGEACKLLINQILRFETSTGKKVRCLRSDNGGEFESKVLADFLKEKGITAERSLPYHHYQNGAIERYNRTVSDMGRAALTDSTLPRSFWGFAFLWANYTLNRVPNKVSGNKTPFEALFGYTPVVDHLRVFGSRAFVLTPPEKRRRLDDRAIAAHVVGYVDGSKGWMLWIPSTNSIVNSAWVQFPDDPLKLTTGTKVPSPQLDPSLLSGSSIDPRLTGPVKALRFVMAVEPTLGDFQDERTVQQQESLQDKLDHQSKSPPTTTPKTYKDILKHPDKAAWLTAIQEELQNLFRHQIWTIELVPDGKRVMGARWVFVEKRTAEGKLIKLKARLLLTVAARCKWPVYSFDFVAAYLHSPIDEEVWVRPPEGLDVPKGYACKLMKALYGTKQAARCWWKHLQGKLHQLGYKPSQYDNSLYILQHPDHKGAIWVHVDDGVVSGSNDDILRKLENELKDCLEIKWAAGIETIVGVEVTRTANGFLLRQKKLVDKILNEHWDHITVARTPLPSGYTTTTVGESEGDRSTSTDYLSIIGSMSYLAVGTRPDLAYAVNYLARFSACPAPDHWKALRHVVNYIANTKDRFLTIHPVDTSNPLKCYSDAGWGGEFQRSSYGIFLTFYDVPILWIARRLHTVAASTCHAEYMALGMATRQLLWVRELIKDILGFEFTGQLICDNEAAIKVGKDDSSNKRTRHTDREFYITNQALFEKKATLVWTPTDKQLADILTKALTPEKHGLLASKVQGEQMP